MPGGATLTGPTNSKRHPAKLIRVRAKAVPGFVSREGRREVWRGAAPRQIRDQL
ncbi:hypothetical protein CKO_05133 [Citrobacter koseri ATCC BAA-895]|uniref:Uncharacterized protein n=1 Tax=Citrobacter koseri (strain ATCC BAA-895 / CDC 4225-83 / SGSC4696) TaxID=290338 RepID=A8ARR3_CITK8|nr:hypothetical protein CKO_05133 [Citrobacter koseri ATCC BAA-895]